MANKLNISIIGKDKLAYEGEARALIVPTSLGIIEVLPEHMQLVSALKKGELLIKLENSEKKFNILGGVLEVRPKSEVVVLVDIERE